MKLQKVEIKGFRSIADMEIPLEGGGHKILVGKNESGKSNILEALNLFSKKKEFRTEDKKLSLQQEHYVKFYVVLNKNEITKIKKSMPSVHDHDWIPILDTNTVFTYTVEVNKDGFWELSLDLDIEAWQDEWLAENLWMQLERVRRRVTFWHYNAKKHDLPSQVDINGFANDPNLCTPLKNMFLLAGIKENKIGEEINEKKELGPNQLYSLLNSVSEKLNNYIKDNWNEYKAVQITLSKDGKAIVIAIEESRPNRFGFSQRSNGFRRLISFFLQVSISGAGQIKNTLILIDEPETGLHPSSAKDLKDHLIKLGRDNVIIYATHSISMIDTDNIENNWIVERKDENTLIHQAKEYGTSPAELVYQAIGYSIYEELKKKNILLEGYSDKEVLKPFLVGDAWEEYGICFTGGVKNIKNTISILDLGGREYFVLSDADEAAKRRCKEMGNPNWWFTYKSLGRDEITIEDFYEQGVFYQIVQKVFANKEMSDHFSELQQKDNDRINSIKKLLKQRQVKKLNDIISEIKNTCLAENNFNREKIEKMLSQLLQQMDSKKAANATR